jgi:hypothetical protein
LNNDEDEQLTQSKLGLEEDNTKRGITKRKS